MTEGTAKALMADLIPPQQRGVAYGMYHAAVGLAAFPASLGAGLLWQGIGGWSGFGASCTFLFRRGHGLAGQPDFRLLGQLTKHPTMPCVAKF